MGWGVGGGGVGGVGWGWGVGGVNALGVAINLLDIYHLSRSA